MEGDCASLGATVRFSILRPTTKAMGFSEVFRITPSMHLAFANTRRILCRWYVKGGGRVRRLE
jgi:hypothetical protein